MALISSAPYFQRQSFRFNLSTTQFLSFFWKNREHILNKKECYPCLTETSKEWTRASRVGSSVFFRKGISKSGPRGKRGRPTGSQEVKGWPTGSQGVKGQAYTTEGPWGQGHTSYLSRKPREFSCKFFLAGVNFFRFNAKIWHFTVYFAVITQKIGNLLCILP